MGQGVGVKGETDREKSGHDPILGVSSVEIRLSYFERYFVEGRN